MPERGGRREKPERSLELLHPTLVELTLTVRDDPGALIVVSPEVRVPDSPLTPDAHLTAPCCMHEPALTPLRRLLPVDHPSPTVPTGPSCSPSLPRPAGRCQYYDQCRCMIQGQTHQRNQSPPNSYGFSRSPLPSPEPFLRCTMTGQR